ncbi:MAG: EamA family transporter [Oscillospiraceae bacterium]|nr:EamA family transporter [Oscillospiraceae bacterium]
MKNFKNSFHPFALATVVCWALAYVFTRMALRHYSPFPLGFLRYFVAALAMIVAVIIIRAQKPRLKDIKWFFACGATGFFLYVIFYNKGCQTVTSATSSVIIALVPVMTSLMAFFIYKEKLSWIQWTAVGVELLGTIVLTVLYGGFSVNIGLFWLLCAAFVLSVYNLLQRQVTKRYSAVEAAAYGIFAGAIMLTIFLPGAIRESSTAAPINILYVLILGVLSSAVAYICWAKAFMKAKKTSSVSNYMFITPFIVSILGYVVAEEAVTSETIIGGAIILFGFAMFNAGPGVIKKIRIKKGLEPKEE